MLAKKKVLTSLELFVIRDLEVRRKKIENLSSSAHFVHTTAKKVVSRRRNNEKDCEITRTVAFLSTVCKFLTHLPSSWLLKNVISCF